MADRRRVLVWARPEFAGLEFVGVKIFVTGATGFIGSAFVRAAIARGHPILALTRNPEILRSKNLSGLTITKGDLSNPNWEEIEAFRPEVCLHAAWIATPGIYLESPENYKFLEWSIDLARRCEQIGVRHFIGTGTCIEYKIENEVLKEESRIAPMTIYAECKNKFRETLVKRAEENDFSYAWGRIFYPYGPGEHPSRLCSSIISKLLRNEKIFLKTPDSTKDYIYIDDLAEALLTIIEKRFAGEINLGSGCGVSVQQIAEIVASQLSKRELVEKGNSQTPDLFPFVVADISRLRSLGWNPRTTLGDGIRNLIASIAA
jgi:nucleoside-diphosphate-sugar epimerase